jgi:hypothetical protein
VRLFDIYEGYVGYIEVAGGKARPIVIMEISDDKENVKAFAVYHKHGYWAEYPEINDLVYEIRNLSTSKLSEFSVINLTRVYDYELRELSRFKKYGFLSIEDIEGLEQKYKTFYQLRTESASVDRARIFDLEEVLVLARKHLPTPGNHIDY